jgi:hypothetical protein
MLLVMGQAVSPEPNVKAGPPPAAEPPALAAARQQAVGASHLLGDFIRRHAF